MDKILLWTLVVVFGGWPVDGLSTDIDKGEIYFTGMSISKTLNVIKISGKVKGFYCDNGKLSIIIAGEEHKRMAVPMIQTKFNGGNWIEGAVRRMTGFDDPEIVDFNVSCSDD